VALFTDTIKTAMAGNTVRAALLFEFLFKSSTERVWPGVYPITAGGHSWRGAGVVLSADGLGARADMAAVTTTINISGVDSNLVTIAKNSASEAKNYPANIYLQFFDVNWQTLDDPVLVKSVIMDVVTYAAVGVDKRNITVSAEDVFVARNYAPYAYYTDRDQNKRFPGDRGLELIGSLVYKVVTWPDF
jgi:hypothetical protein